MVSKLRKYGPPVIVLAVFIVLWQAAVAVFDIEPYILPSPLAIASNTVSEAPRLFHHTLSTLGV
ncbi:ABC transporter permease, partial [Paenibacillus sepulcri]|nr:ABC transporter permease [Paenibacillus sepulcri]